ncbi:DUF3618 domain-containing protein [Diaminobutyricibacter sp. McL0618]|uniref:DUF3618 domain-containing protein n=1 Tax=Leifsonia sp. McL0618 TaxID=3415677 RepID=UPI003CF52B09
MTTETPSDIERARAELTATLDAIEDKLNVPKRARLAVERAGRRAQKLRDENPVAFVATAVGAAALVGGAVWLVVRAVRN